MSPLPPDPLYQRLALRVDDWRARRYACPSHPAVAEILEFARETDEGAQRHLRRAQVRAIETWWYLRLVEKTPRMVDLYRRLYPKTPELLAALGLGRQEFLYEALDLGVEGLLDRIRTDDAFVRTHKLESLRETLTLAYPSYILALAMGAGKTLLMGAIVATEFSLAMEYPDDPTFVRNALIFAPGTTILASLRELVVAPYDRILPPRFHADFAASVKITFTRDGSPDIPVIPGSHYNLVVTNTEKIRLRKEQIRKSDLGTLRLFDDQRTEEAREAVANRRLQAIASLPHLAVFSDEAHHTYGQSLDTGLKKVRRTVDYLAANTSLAVVANTTGTPFFQRQPLKDVVTWYGLSQGIDDGILKDPSGNIHAYDLGGDPRRFAREVILNFFKGYAHVRLPDGSPAKLAVYFPQTDDIHDCRAFIDAAMVEAGQSPAEVLVNTSDTTLTNQDAIEAFNALNHPRSPFRVVLLVNKGTEGWNCPSLFACALARDLKSSNNFVLQAATRCLRQVPGNRVKARIYLSPGNRKTLDRQLEETYGETISDLFNGGTETRPLKLVVRKPEIPPLLVTVPVRTVVRRESGSGKLVLERPPDAAPPRFSRATYVLAHHASSANVLRQVGFSVEAESVSPPAMDVFAASQELASLTRTDPWRVLAELRRLYPAEEVPLSHLGGLQEQIEGAMWRDDVVEDTMDRALALVRLDGGWFKAEPDGKGGEVYTADINYPVGREKQKLILSFDDVQDNQGGFGFHYSPYAFDSAPEKSYIEQVLALLHLSPGEVEDVYYTGALTGASQTDFFVEYRDPQGRWRRYTPDFVIRKRPAAGASPGSGRVLIVEIKSERERSHPVDGETGVKQAAIRTWEGLNPDRLKYEMVFVAREAVTGEDLAGTERFVRATDGGGDAT